jgi:hypothetical protein
MVKPAKNMDAAYLGLKVRRNGRYKAFMSMDSGGAPALTENFVLVRAVRVVS